MSVVNLTFPEYLAEYVLTAVTHPRWRNGQAAFNALHQIRPDIAEKVRGSSFDPFHQEQALQEFWTFVESEW